MAVLPAADQGSGEVGVPDYPQLVGVSGDRVHVFPEVPEGEVVANGVRVPHGVEGRLVPEMILPTLTTLPCRIVPPRVLLGPVLEFPP